MRLSSFNLYLEGYPDPGTALVHNTFTGAYLVLAAEQLEALKRADSGQPLTERERALAEDADLRDPDVGVVVETRAAEEAAYRAWFERRRARKQSLDVTVGVNLACNFACTYCSQAEVLDGSTMSFETADLTARWISERARTVGVAAVEIRFVGGEPLLHVDRVARIARGVREGLAESGIAFSFGLITNGYFLTADVIDELVPLGLATAQVTLDGDHSTHSKTRVSKKGEDTFRRIFDNVIAASRRIRLIVRGNYQTETIDGFEPLVEKLAEAGLTPGSRIGFQPAVAGLSTAADAGLVSCTWAGSDTSPQIALHDAVLRHGFDPGAALHVIGPCEFHDHHSFAIEPDGVLYKCPGFLGHPEWGIGHVRSGLSPRYQQMLRVNPQRECGTCSHRPNCAGGCIATEWIAQGRMEGVACEQSYFDRIKDASLPREYLLNTLDERAAAIAAFPPAPTTFKKAPQPAARGRRSEALRVMAA